MLAAPRDRERTRAQPDHFGREADHLAPADLTDTDVVSSRIPERWMDGEVVVGRGLGPSTNDRHSPRERPQRLHVRHRILSRVSYTCLRCGAVACIDAVFHDICIIHRTDADAATAHDEHASEQRDFSTPREFHGQLSLFCGSKHCPWNATHGESQGRTMQPVQVG